MDEEKKVPSAEEVQEEPEKQEVPAEDSAEAMTPENAEDTLIAELQNTILNLTKERDANLEMAKRQMADFANYKRRTENSRKDAVEETVRDTVAKFLPVMDNLERALAAAGEAEGPLKDGIEMVQRQTQKVFDQLHVEAIDPQGEPFDANSMNAVMQGTEEEGEPGTVCAVMQKGYRIGDRVIRHAMVKVVAG